MKTLLLNISLFLCLNTVFGQNLIAKKAPLNPLPLEELAYMVPSLIDGEITYYKGHFYNDKREQLLENGESFRSYANWTEKKLVMLKNSEPKFIIPIVPKPDDLKIYSGRKYNNEVIPS